MLSFTAILAPLLVSGELYVFHAATHSVTVSDAASKKVIATTELPGRPTAAVADLSAHRIFVALGDKNVLVALDTATHRLALAWPLAGCEEPQRLAIESANHRLHVGCRGPRLVILDASTGKRLGSRPMHSLDEIGRGS